MVTCGRPYNDLAVPGYNVADTPTNFGKTGIGFSYAPNRLRDGAPVDPRARSLLDSLYRCVSEA